MDHKHKLIRKLFVLLSLVYPEKIIEALKVFHRYIYSGKILRKTAQHGSSFDITPWANVKGTQYMSIGENFTAREGLNLECWDEYAGEKFTPKLSIGDNVSIGRNNHIGCINTVTLGSNLLTGNNVYITDHFHGNITAQELGIPPIKRKLSSKGPVEIGNNVWLGDNVVIMPNVKIGNNVIVGANAVVTKNIEDNKVVAGVPAKVINTL